MSRADQEKWNQKYRDGAFERRTHPSALLEEWLPRLMPSFRSNTPCALDIACGAGRNSLYLAENGFVVDAVDISAVGIARAELTAAAKNLSINWIEQDLDSGLPNDIGRYDLIIMMRYVNLPLLQVLLNHLNPGGIFICEQHLLSDAVVVGPQNPNFRVAPGALTAAFCELDIEHQFEGIIDEPDGTHAAVARVVARKPN